jgi:hypothetical protein
MPVSLVQRVVPPGHRSVQVTAQALLLQALPGHAVAAPHEGQVGVVASQT